MKLIRGTYVLAALLLVALFLMAGCAGTAPAAEPDAQTPAAVATTGSETVEPSAGTTEAPSASPAGETTESPADAAADAATEAAPETTASPSVAATAVTTGTTGTAATPGVNDVTFTATEYQFDAPESIPAGWTRFTLDNQGEQPHDLMLLKPEAGKTITDVLSALQSEGPPDWVELYGGVSAAPGETGEYVVNLDAGDYIGLSFGQNESGPPDAAQGMIHAFTVTGEGAELSAEELPQANATVDMIDFAFAISGTLSSGEQTIRVLNSGKALHEMQVFRLNEGVTFDQFKSMLDQEPTQGQEPPFTYVGGPVISPGVDGFVTMNLEPGTHVLVCFIPAPEHDGQPHWKLGMITQVEIE